MVEKSKPAWPRTPNGNIDWETVFEDPETGLIARVTRTRKPSTLRANTVAVIGKLYGKEETPETFAQFVAGLEDTIPDHMSNDDLALAAETITGIMRAIKNERMEQIAQVNAARKRQKTVAERKQEKTANSRGGAKSRRRGKKRPSVKRRVMIFSAVATITLLLFGGGIVAWFYMAGPGSSP